MGFHPSDAQCAEIAATCIAYLSEKTSQDRGLFKTTPNMTDANWLFKGLAKGTVSSIRDENIENYIHVVLGALQVSLKEMRFSILHDAYADLVAIDSSELEDPDELSQRLVQVLPKLTPVRFNLVKTLCALLSKVSMQLAGKEGNSMSSSSFFLQNSSVDMMMDGAGGGGYGMGGKDGNSATSFIATVMAPYMARLPEHESSYMSIRHTKDLKTLRPILEFLIENQADIFRGLAPLPTPVVVPSVKPAGFGANIDRNASKSATLSGFGNAAGAQGAGNFMSRSLEFKGGDMGNPQPQVASGSPGVGSGEPSPASHFVRTLSDKGGDDDDDEMQCNDVSMSSTFSSDSHSSTQSQKHPYIPHLSIPGSSGGGSTADGLNAHGHNQGHMHGGDNGNSSMSSIVSMHNVNVNSWEWKVFEAMVSSTVLGYLSGSSSANNSGNAPLAGTHSQPFANTNATLSPCPSFTYSMMRKYSITADDDNYDSVGGSSIGGFAVNSPSSSGGGGGGGGGIDGCNLFGADFGAKGGSATAAAVRRQMVMDCRKLRSQICKFEEEFSAQHQRAPKATERGAAQSVYTKYRALKKEIRHLAVIEIQRIGRGFVARRKTSMLSANGGSRGHKDAVTSFSHSGVFDISSNAGNRSAGAPDRMFKDSSVLRTSFDAGALGIKDLENDPDPNTNDTSGSQPMDVAGFTPPPLAGGAGGDSQSNSADPLSLSSTMDASSIVAMGKRGGNAASGGPAINNNSSARPLTPGVTAQGNSAALLSNTAVNSQLSPGAKSSASGGSGATELYARYNELLSEKRELKKVLKRFDEEFALKHGRQPMKAEKEVMRPKYQKYHELKHDMDVLRSTIETKHGPMPSDEEQDSAAAASSGGSAHMAVDGADGAKAGGYSRDRANSDDRVFADVSGSDDAAMGKGGSRGSSYKKDSKQAGFKQGEGNSSVLAPPPRNTFPLVKDSMTPENMNSLQEEKKSLHLFLKSYEREFTKTNGRPVIKHEDIQPVASEYQRYKDLKTFLKDASSH